MAVLFAVSLDDKPAHVAPVATHDDVRLLPDAHLFEKIEARKPAPFARKEPPAQRERALPLARRLERTKRADDVLRRKSAAASSSISWMLGAVTRKVSAPTW